MADPIHILVIEDEPSVQTLLRKQLTANGFHVTVANDGLDALLKLETVRPNLILCDMMMPNLDGVEFVRAIKQHLETQRIPVIFLTAKVQESEVARALALGAAGCIGKPFDALTLGNQVRTILGQ